MKKKNCHFSLIHIPVSLQASIGVCVWVRERERDREREREYLQYECLNIDGCKSCRKSHSQTSRSVCTRVRMPQSVWKDKRMINDQIC